jgi:hypothetical protein
MEMIQMLWDEIATCTKVNDKGNGALFKALEIVKDLKGPPLIRDSMIITKEQWNTELGVVKASWESEFDDLT